MKWRFALRFLLTFSALVVVWWAVDVAGFYRTMALACTQAVSPVVNGWELVFDAADVSFRRGNDTMPMLLDVPTLSLSLMPFVSLVVATPRLGWQRAVLVAIVGCVLYFLLHVAVLLAYPYILDQPNMFKDTLGVFSGLVTFVVAPLALWFVLTYPALRSLWRLTPDPSTERPAR